MTRIGDIITEGTPEEFSASLREKIDAFEGKAEEIWLRTDLGDARRVYPGLLRCTARQLRILDESGNLPIEVTAGACRTVFEVNIRTRLAVADPAYLMKFQLEFAGDEQSLIGAFLKLANPGDTGSARKILEDRLGQIRAVMDRRGVEPAKPANVRNNAEAAGVVEEYDTLYRVYSKYVHASGWLILAPDERREGEEWEKILAIMTQSYAGDTFKRIADAVENARPNVGSKH